MSAGRPRAFCTEKALDSALTVFWKKGYEGTSLPDLTEAMGINRPSLYAAFGNKESLFMKALDRYVEKNGCIAQALDTKDLRTGMETLLYRIVDRLTDPETPHGCLSVNAALSCSEETNRIKEALAERRRYTETAIRERFEAARQQDELPKAFEPAGLARYFNTLIQGLSVQSSSGATRDQLRDVVATAMLAWPR